MEGKAYTHDEAVDLIKEFFKVKKELEEQQIVHELTEEEILQEEKEDEILKQFGM